MNAPENFYAILGVPIDADSDTLKRAYRQLARRYHPDLAGPDGAVEMKRINRAYAVLSDPEKRQQYDTVIGGVIDLRKKGFVRPRPHPQAVDPAEDLEFSGLNIFSTKGPLHTGPTIHSTLGVSSALSSVHTVQGLLIAAGSLDGKGMLWQMVNDKVEAATSITADPTFTVESLRELRFSAAGGLLAGWGRLGLHVWDAYNGELLWSHSLIQRAVSAHYSLDMTLQVTPDGKRQAQMALPLLAEDPRSPNAWGVRGTDILSHDLSTPAASLSDPLVCTEEKPGNRRFWAIRMRALSQDTHTLVTLSCAQMPHEQQHMILVRRWDLIAKGRMSSKARPQITASIMVGRCEDCTPPYAITPDASMIAFVSTGRKILLCDTITNTYSEIASGTMGGSSKLALSPDASWLAVAREDSEINEGVIDLWSISTGQIVQKLYHPWQISALHFADQRLVVALTDGTIQVWE
ncbi:MAG: DnaJ domain-containing protein [Chloroflexi bacterium]|nr:DnaJ domain-containing protein [Chloroflexota bacterium]